MKRNIFLEICLLAIVFVVAILFVYSYFKIQNKFSEMQPPLMANTRSENNSAVTEITSSTSEEYTLQVSVTGHLKEQGNGKPVLAAEDGDYELVLGPKTEIFRNGERSVISDIQIIDLVSVLGRKRTQESKEISVDSVYANTDEENVSAPPLPSL